MTEEVIAAYLGTEHLDSENVESLSPDVLGSHVNLALHAKLGARRRGGDSVLTGSSLGDDGVLAESSGKEDLFEDKRHTHIYICI